VILRAGLLEGRRLALAGGVAAAIQTSLQALGAHTESMPAEALREEDAAAAWVSERAPLHGLVLETGSVPQGTGHTALTGALRMAWIATRAVATGALIPAGQPTKVTLIAPRPGTGDHAPAASAALENLARTLSVEWARFGVTVVAVCPGAHTAESDLATLICFLHSMAGEYLTGCRFDLDAVADMAVGGAPTPS
jgi:citronellol/citronellal dehydrogenase